MSEITQLLAQYPVLLVMGFCVVFFGRGAHHDQRSALKWGGLSLLCWLGFTALFVPGVIGGLISQVLLFLGYTLYGAYFERRSPVV